MTVRRVSNIVFGVLLVMIGVALIAGGVTALAANRDGDGFHSTEAFTFESTTSAIVADPLRGMAEVPSWVIDLFVEPSELRIEGSAPSGGPIFIGVAPTTDADRYIADVARDEVVNLELDGATITGVEYERTDGTSVAPPPGSSDIWAASADGRGTQAMIWDIGTARVVELPAVESGRWMVVVMNSDATPGVQADLTFAVRNPAITTFAWGSLALGIVLVLLGAFLVYKGARRPRRGDEAGIRDLQHEERSLDMLSSRGWSAGAPGV